MAFSTVTRTPIQVRINSQPITSQQELLNEKLNEKAQNENPVIYVNSAYPKTQNPTWTARKNNMHYSSWKLMACANLITGKHIYDAMNIIAQVDKKGGPIVKSVLMAARKNGENKGFTEDRMFVKTSIVNKRNSHKKLDIKGRGKMGVITVPRCSLVITLEERSAADYYKMIMAGKAPGGVAHTMRKFLYQKDASLEEVQALSHITTSQGRRYRRLQFKRLTQVVKSEYKQRGIDMSEKKIERNLLEKAARDYIELSEKATEERLLTSRASRQALFEKNYKKY